MKRFFITCAAAGLVATMSVSAFAAPVVHERMDNGAYTVERSANPPAYASGRSTPGDTSGDRSYYRQLDMETGHGDGH